VSGSVQLMLHKRADPTAHR